MGKVNSHPLSREMTAGLASLAGGASWVAGIVPSVRTFVTMLYGAVHEAERREDAPAEETRKRPRTLTFAKQVEFPLRWIQAFLTRGPTRPLQDSLSC